MEFNIWALPLAALVPMLLGSLWYSPLLFGKAWQQEAGLTDEQLQGANMPLIMLLSYFFSCFLAAGLLLSTVHQISIMELWASKEGFGVAGSAAQTEFESVLAMVGNRHLSFQHGLLHGMETGFLIALPILVIKSLFEQKSWKYIGLNAAYWILAMGLMGAIVCQWGVTVV